MSSLGALGVRVASSSMVNEFNDSIIPSSFFSLHGRLDTYHVRLPIFIPHGRWVVRLPTIVYSSRTCGCRPASAESRVAGIQLLLMLALQRNRLVAGTCSPY